MLQRKLLIFSIFMFVCSTVRADDFDIGSKISRIELLSIVSGKLATFSNGWTRTYFSDGTLHARCSIDWLESDGTWKITADGKLCNKYVSYKLPFVCGGHDGFFCWRMYKVPGIPTQLQYRGKRTGTTHIVVFSDIE